MLGLKIVIIFIFGFIFWQDYKDRLVYWFLYPLVGIVGLLIQINHVSLYMLIVNTLINLILILTVLLVLFVYTKIILKKGFINHSIGVGDLLFFIFLCFCFSMISFVVLFVFSLLFSLLMHFILKTRYAKTETLPLAGYMSFFFAMIYGFSFFINSNFIFAY